MAAGEGVVQLYGEMSNARYDRKVFKGRLHAWSKTDPEHTDCGFEMNGHVLMKDTTSDELLQAMMIADAKSLYDSIKRTAKGKEPRVALAVGEIKESMAVIGAIPRWIPHNKMLADSLTKVLSKSNATPLLQALKSGKYKIVAEDDELRQRAYEKEQQGRASRLKGFGDAR